MLIYTTNTIFTRVNISNYMLLKILTIMRAAMTHDVPYFFEDTVEIDETYLGVHGKHKGLSVKRASEPAKRGRGTTKQAFRRGERL